MVRVVRFYVNHSSPPCPPHRAGPQPQNPDQSVARRTWIASAWGVECHNVGRYSSHICQKEFRKRCQIAWQQQLSEVMPDRMPKAMWKDVPECQQICQIERADPTMSTYARYYVWKRWLECQKECQKMCQKQMPDKTRESIRARVRFERKFRIASGVKLGSLRAWILDRSGRKLLVHWAPLCIMRARQASEGKRRVRGVRCDSVCQ